VIAWHLDIVENDERVLLIKGLENGWSNLSKLAAALSRYS
jgi:hypothetical protein